MKNKINLRGTLHATDWLADIRYAPAEETEIIQVLFKNTRSGFYRNPEHIPLRRGDWVAVEASPGHDIGQIMLTGPLVRLQMKKSGVSADSDIKKIFRKASEADLDKFREARDREHTTMIRSRQIAAELGLNMKIGDVEFQGDGAKAIFYYIADERVDFRKLIRILADTFKIRIEMKQIGARQEAGRIGGIGPCGRPLCCSSWMSKFVSVGTGAARIQDLSMNPQKLAGQCAKLKCCLNFETDSYAEAAKEFPSKDIVLITQDQEYYQFKTDILARKITYSTDKHQAVNLVTISADRAKEIIEINRRGEKPEQLEPSKTPAPQRQEYVEIVGQDSLTRFDKKGKKKKKAKGAPQKKQEKEEKQPDEQTRKQSSAGRKAERPKDSPSAQQKAGPKENQKERQKERSKERQKENTAKAVRENSPAQPKDNSANASKENSRRRRQRPQQGRDGEQKPKPAPVPDNTPPVRKDYSGGANASSSKSQRNRNSAERRSQDDSAK